MLNLTGPHSEALTTQECVEILTDAGIEVIYGPVVEYPSSDGSKTLIRVHEAVSLIRYKIVTSSDCTLTFIHLN